jgi:hypothetical protein
MAAPKNSRRHGGDNATGKPGNASGPNRREARGPLTVPGGKHPPPRIFTSPQTEKKVKSRVRAGYRSRQSHRG